MLRHKLILIFEMMEEESSYSEPISVTDNRQLPIVAQLTRMAYPYNCFGLAHFQDVFSSQSINSNQCVLIGPRLALTTFHSILPQENSKISIYLPVYCTFFDKSVKVLKWRGHSSYYKLLKDKLKYDDLVSEGDSENSPSNREQIYQNQKLGDEAYRKTIKRDYALLYLSEPVYTNIQQKEKSRYIWVVPRPQRSVNLQIFSHKQKIVTNVHDEQKTTKNYDLTEQKIKLVESHLAQNWKGMSGAGVVTERQEGNYELVYLHKGNFVTGGMIVPVTELMRDSIDRWAKKMKEKGSQPTPTFFRRLWRQMAEEKGQMINEEEQRGREQQEGQVEEDSMSEGELEIQETEKRIREKAARQLNLNYLSLSSQVFSYSEVLRKKQELSEWQIRRIRMEEQARQRRAEERWRQVQQVQKEVQRRRREGPPPISQAYKDIERGVKILLQAFGIRRGNQLL